MQDFAQKRIRAFILVWILLFSGSLVLRGALNVIWDYVIAHPDVAPYIGYGWLALVMGVAAWLFTTP